MGAHEQLGGGAGPRGTGQGLLRGPPVHSPTVDPPEHDPSAWTGEAKLAAQAVEQGTATVGAPHTFHLDLTEVVHTRVEGDRLVIRSWHPRRGVEERSQS